MIAMDHFDSDLLAYEDEFPLEETFRIVWGIDAGGRARRFTPYIVPPRVFPQSGALMMRPRLCVADRVSCQPVPGEMTTYFGSDQPRITIEVALPWRPVGVTQPTSQEHLRMEIAATARHRSRWMSWSGLPPVQSMQNPSRWDLVGLADY
jgi:hypothetical protein